MRENKTYVFLITCLSAAVRIKLDAGQLWLEPGRLTRIKLGKCQGALSQTVIIREITVLVSFEDFQTIRNRERNGSS
jgi:hypothetical protein